MILYDFHCEHCDQRFEALVDSGETQAECQCGEMADRVMSAPHVGVLNDPAAREAALRRRSHEHSMREAKKNPEQLASKFGARAKVQQPWNLRSRKSS